MLHGVCTLITEQNAAIMFSSPQLTGFGWSSLKCWGNVSVTESDLWGHNLPVCSLARHASPHILQSMQIRLALQRRRSRVLVTGNWKQGPDVKTLLPPRLFNEQLRLASASLLLLNFLNWALIKGRHSTNVSRTQQCLVLLSCSLLLCN